MKRALILSLTWPMLTGAQTVSGKITMGGSGLSVRGARLVLIDSAGSARMGALSDSAGSYSMAVKKGSYQMKATGPNGGDATVTPFFSVATDRPTHLDIALVASTQLAAIQVTGKRDIDVSSAIDPHKFDEFIRRRELGAGHFMTRDQIEVKNVRVSRDLLAGIPGITVRQDADSSVIQSTRCSGKTIPGLDTGTLVGGALSGPDNKLQPMLFIDGQRMRDLHIMDDIQPGEIEAIEVYQGASELPAEAKGDACFAIYIWLKTGGKAK